MMDDIEASTRRLYQHSATLQTEAGRHLNMLSGVGDDMDSVSDRLHAEARHAAQARMNRDQGFCFLYTVIFLESVSLLTLLYYGL